MTIKTVNTVQHCTKWILVKWDKPIAYINMRAVPDHVKQQLITMGYKFQLSTYDNEIKT